ncbi:MAG: hypothetical protein CM1200mP2_51690 [Planctomycetaceae bacterium]|nr:MAG: hypothetical protein CM1200mP2_51690 [Planctomycetaceae bacterium]
MKTAGFQYINVLGISLLVTAFAWTSLLGARDTGLSVPRMMKAARLFERQGRQLKAAEMYRRVLRVAPGNAYAAQRLKALRAVSSRLMEMSVVGSASETEVRRVASFRAAPNLLRNLLRKRRWFRQPEAQKRSSIPLAWHWQRFERRLPASRCRRPATPRLVSGKTKP